MNCPYCTPNRHGHRKALSINRFVLRNQRNKINILKIFRGRNKKKNYFLGVHSKDISDGGTMMRNNGFQNVQEINYCPMCGRDLQQKLGGI